MVCRQVASITTRSLPQTYKSQTPHHSYCLRICILTRSPGYLIVLENLGIWSFRTTVAIVIYKLTYMLKDPFISFQCQHLWITALPWWRGLHNSMKLWAMPCRAIQDVWVIVKGSDKMWFTRGENGNALQYSCHENPMSRIKGQKAVTPEDKPPCWKVSIMLLGKIRGQLLIASGRMKWLGQSRNDSQLWICQMVKVKCLL